jgi:hypothetical protein
MSTKVSAHTPSSDLIELLFEISGMEHASNRHISQNFDFTNELARHAAVRIFATNSHTRPGSSSSIDPNRSLSFPDYPSRDPTHAAAINSDAIRCGRYSNDAALRSLAERARGFSGKGAAASKEAEALDLCPVVEPHAKDTGACTWLNNRLVPEALGESAY